MKKTHKTTGLVLAIIIAMSLIFTSCNSKSSESTSQPTPEKPAAVTLKLATTTSVDDSGLLAYLAPYLKDEENITLDILAQGSGQAIKTAEDGNCDILIAHSPAAEEEFVESGYGIDRVQFMYNYFVIVGPTADPADVKDAVDASSAFAGIYDTFQTNPSCIFYSRDDSSGTDVKEKELWADAKIDVNSLPADFYQRTGTKMLDTLIMADNTDGYTLTDKSTFLANEDKLPALDILLEQNDQLKNVYSVTLINPDKYPDLQNDAAKRFHDWLLKDSTQTLIAEYGLAEYGQSLFFVN
ncbi:MAG: substrate-binding domain-containing protein [Clostridiales bacterium]|jgi:tungstate transport system substrate-binding protein|nr:substrate-binding domain-containing protein [Clostridiales bacterium]